MLISDCRMLIGCTGHVLFPDFRPHLECFFWALYKLDVTSSSPPFELPIPELLKRKGKGRRQSEVSAFHTPERSRTSAPRIFDSRDISESLSQSHTADQSRKSEFAAKGQPDTSETSYYTAAWGSPYDIPSSKNTPNFERGRRNSDTALEDSPLVSKRVRDTSSIQPRSAGLAKPFQLDEIASSSEDTASNSAAYDLTGDWIREYHRTRAERKTWLSDGSDNSASSPVSSEEDEEELDNWPEFHLSPPAFRSQNNHNSKPNTKSRAPGHKHLPSDATLTQETFDAVEKPLSERQSRAAKMLSALMSGGIPRRERPGESASEKESSVAPSNRTASESPINVEQTSTASGTHRQRPSVVAANSFQRPKKKVVWKGKTCTIALPLEAARDNEGRPKKPLTRQEVANKLTRWESNGISIRGFDLIQETFDALAGQSRKIYPDPSESSSAFQQKSFNVRIPDKQQWDQYVRELQEAKLRALGVSLASEEVPARSPSVTSSMGRQASSQGLYPQGSGPPLSANSFRGMTERVLSPSASVFTPQYPFPQAIASPGITPGMPLSAGYHAVNQSISFSRERIFSPMTSAADSASASAGTQYLGSVPTSRGVSPLIDHRRQSIRSLNSPVSPLPEMVQNAYRPGQTDRPILPQRQDQASPMLPYDYTAMLQQEVSKNLAEPKPPQFFSQPEIASPLPQGRSHRHNVSESLQKEIDEAEYHLEESIARQMVKPEDGATYEPPKDTNLPSVKEEAPRRNSPEPPLKSADPVSESKAAPSQENPPATSTLKPAPSKNSSHRASISKLNVNAQEFTPMFTFGDRTPAAPLSSAANSFSGPPSSSYPITPASSFGLNVAAPAFVPGKAFEPSPNRVFSFSSAISSPKSDIPTLNSGVAFGEIPGGLMDKRPAAVKIFSQNMIQIPKKTKAVPIVQPESEDEVPEDEEGRPMQDEGRQKRARYSGGSGDEIPLFAEPSDDAKVQPDSLDSGKVQEKEHETSLAIATEHGALGDAQTEPATVAMQVEEATKATEEPSIKELMSDTKPADVDAVPDRLPELDILSETEAEDKNEIVKVSQNQTPDSPKVPDLPPRTNSGSDLAVKDSIAEDKLQLVSPRAFEELGDEEEDEAVQESVPNGQPLEPSLPTPLKRVSSTLMETTDTALNTADFLKTPANITSPLSKESLENEISPNDVDHSPSLSLVTEPVRTGKSLEDPFTIGDHDDGNVTDKSVPEVQNTSSKPEVAQEKPEMMEIAASAKEGNSVGERIPDIIVKKSKLSATAKPFVFNPSALNFTPGPPSQQPTTSTKIDKEVSENKPSPPAPAAREPQPDTAKAMPLSAQSTTSSVPTPKQELPPKKLAFSGGLGASRYAQEPVAEPVREPQRLSTPPPKASQPEPEPPKSQAPKERSRTVTPEPQTLVEEPKRRVSLPEPSTPIKDDHQASARQYTTPPRKQLSLDERIAAGVKYIEPSFNEIDAVMRQLNGDDSDAGIERNPEQVWRSPKAADREKEELRDRVVTPESIRLKMASRIPTSSPNQLDRPFQYLPNQDYGSSNSEESEIRDAAAEMVARNARYSPSYKGPQHVKAERSPVRKLNRTSPSDISNWDDIVSSGEETDFHGRVGFFDNRVGHVVANAIDDRLRPIETTLGELAASLTKLGERSRSSRPRASRSVESDADDEDEETIVRAVSPILKDRKFEKLKSMLLETVTQYNAPEQKLSEVVASVAELKTELGKIQETTANDKSTESQVISDLAESMAEIKKIVSSREITKELEQTGEDTATSKEITASLPPIHASDLLEKMAELQKAFAEQHKLNSSTVENVVDAAIEKHARGQSTVIKSSQDSANAEKLQLQLTGLESLLKNAEERAVEEAKLRREVEDRLSATERELKSAISEAVQQRDAAEQIERSLESMASAHQHIKRHTALVEEDKAELEKNNSDLQAKNTALEETIAEYRISHQEWRRDLDAAKMEKQEFLHSIKTLQQELADGMASRQALKVKFERVENEMLAARHGIARDQAMWRHKEEEHKAKHDLTGARLEAEARTRERLELEIERLEKQEKEALKARTLVENIRSQNDNLAGMLNDLRAKDNSSQQRVAALTRELHDVKERNHLETQRMLSVAKSDMESSNQQAQSVRADFESAISRLEDQLEHSQAEAKNTKDRYQALLEEASVSRDTALREAAEAREAALQEHYRFHERTIHESQVSHERYINEVKADHARAFANTHEDHERAVSNLMDDHKRSVAALVQQNQINEQSLQGQLALSDDRVLHFQDKIKHLEDKLEIANSAAQAAAEAARNAKKDSSSGTPSSMTAPSLRGFDPQALRQTVETLQDQLGERERQIEQLEQQIESFDTEAPNKLKERDAEVTWLRELLGVRMDDMQDIIVQLSTPHFDRAAIRDAVIRLRTSLQMEQQERERQAGNVKIPSLAEIRASPKALPMAAAAAWGSWRRGQTSLSSLAEMAVPSTSSSADQTPSKSSPQSFLSGLLTPPNTNIRQTTPRGSGSGSLSRSTRSAQRPLANFSTPKRQIQANYETRQEEEIREDVPVTPSLLTQASYDADAPEGSHHYSLDQYAQEPADLPSEDTSQQGDNDSSPIIKEDSTSSPNPFGPSIELAG